MSHITNAKMRKSQIHMGETVNVLLIFFVILIIGFIFYTSVVTSTVKAKADENVQLESIALAQKASFLPELQCSDENIVTEDCIDLLKLETSSSVISKNQVFYYDIFGFSTIRAQEVYPGTRSFTLYNRPMENFRSKVVSHVPMTFYDPRTKNYAFGVLEVERYSK